jgi:hypothetical protein
MAFFGQKGRQGYGYAQMTRECGLQIASYDKQKL